MGPLGQKVGRPKGPIFLCGKPQFGKNGPAQMLGKKEKIKVLLEYDIPSLGTAELMLFTGCYYMHLLAVRGVT